MQTLAIITYQGRGFQGIEDKFSIRIINPKEFLYLVGIIK